MPEADWSKEEVNTTKYRKEKEMLIKSLTSGRTRQQIVDFNTRYKPDPETKLWKYEEGNLLDIISGPIVADIRCT